MKAMQIVFTQINKAELIEVECRPPTDNEVIVQMAFTTISQGTERANITGSIDVSIAEEHSAGKPVFPRYGGYSNSGIVVATGRNVRNFKQGDRVAGWWGAHKSYCEFPESNLILLDSKVSLDAASIAHIACFSMAAIRKTRLEIGESVTVMGLGILGMLAIQQLRAAGATPIIAVDPINKRRLQALENGADYAFDPYQTDFVQKVVEITNGGTKVAIEVTGVGKALEQTLNIMAPRGRVALLGCTRESDFTIDYYRKVHGPGISLIGAHTSARPRQDSYPGYWTIQDEMAGILDLQKYGRLNMQKIITEIHSPKAATIVYNRLISEKEFPIGVQFDWLQLV